MMQLVDFLYEQSVKDAQIATQLTLLELPNLLALLDWLPGRASPEQIVGAAGKVEQLLAPLGRPVALARAVAVRTSAAQQSGAWSRASSNSDGQTVERLLDAGDLPRAYQAAAALHQRALAAGETAYPDAAYDIAVAHILLGRVLRMGGEAAAALPVLAEAQRRFQALADGGNASAVRMAAGSIQEQGDCLAAIGKLEEAVTAYETAGLAAEKLGDTRSVAVTKVQLGTVHLYQERYADALAAWEAARAIFEDLGEPAGVATAWHLIGVMHRETQQFEAAERSYRQALRIRVQHNLRLDEAASLDELGSLYSSMRRTEEAIFFHRQAADIRWTLQDVKSEGISRNNLALAFFELGRTDEARREILRAIECDKPYGHAAEPWKTFAILYAIDQTAGNGAAAAAAWRQARYAYLAYRRDGGYAQAGFGKVCDVVWQAVQQGGAALGAAALRQATANWEPTVALERLQTILAGAHDPALADDPELPYAVSAELLLLLERLGG